MSLQQFNLQHRLALAGGSRIGGMRRRLALGGDAALAEFRQLLAAGDPDAVQIYRKHQEESLGPDPLAEGACEWPAELSEPGVVIDVPRSEPIVGWRMWAVHGSTLAAPFLTTDGRGTHKTPGLAWKAGVNTVSARWCVGTGTHPLAECACGIRAVQSRTVIDRFAEQMHERLGDPGAIAQVAVWGRVASYRADDDWRYTLRAQHARITGPLYVGPEQYDRRADLERRYRVTCEVISLMPGHRAG